MNYAEALEYLGGLNSFAVKLGLESTRRMLDKFGRPEEGLNFIHVAGTNGKGSVCAFASSILTAAGRRPGMFTSPHLERPEERIQVGGVRITEETFAALATRVADAVARVRRADPDYTLTYFEHMTVMGLLHFRETGADPCILEVGLGGRLDATNVVRARTAVITHLSLDHTAHLGETVEEIAAEKLAIVKAGSRAVACPDRESLKRLVLETCEKKGAEALLLGRDFEAAGSPDNMSYRGRSLSLEGLRLGLAGKHQTMNAALAIAAAETLSNPVDEAAVRRGLLEARWPGRLEFFPGNPPVLLDGAHNPAGAGTLAAYLKEKYGGARIVLVTGIKSVKKHGEFYPKILPLCARAIFTRGCEGTWAEPEELAEAYGAFVPRWETEADPAAALERARADGEADLVLVTGSLHILGEVRPLLSSK